MKKALAAAAVIFTLSTSLSHAQAVFGMPDCGQWTQAPNPTRKAWLLGYLSGANAFNDIHMIFQKKTPPDHLNKINSADQIFTWMDNYCRAQPLKTVGDGAFELMLELANKK